MMLLLLQVHDGAVPCNNNFRTWAVAKLIELAKGIGGPDAAKIQMPPFVSRAC